MMMMTKLLGGSTAALAIACIVMGITISYKNNTIAARDARITTLEERQDLTVAALKKATGNDKLVAKDIPTQIDLLGESLIGAKKSITNQNTEIDNLSKDRDKALREADRQSALRKGVIERSKQLEIQLADLALEPVERERLEEELRRVQDLAFKGGL